MLKHHRLVTEGLITGLYGVAAVAVAFLIFDALTRQPFYTPVTLGSDISSGSVAPTLAMPDHSPLCTLQAALCKQVALAVWARPM